MLSSYNGEKYIEDQINSILSQKEVDIELLVRDDGSSDSTCNIIKSINDSRIFLYKGENIGATSSFFDLIAVAQEYDYYAFSDQDDIWDNDKILVAINKLKNLTMPAVYSSNTRLVDENLNILHNTLFVPKTELGSACIKNYVTGCTAVFNQSLMNMLKQYKPQNAPYHDWWINLVVLALGGKSIYDPVPHISYRQHGNNVVGASNHVIKKWKRRLKVFCTKKYRRDLMAKEILENYGDDICEENYDTLVRLKNVKRFPWQVVFSKKFRTGNLGVDLAFAVCALTKRI